MQLPPRNPAYPQFLRFDGTDIIMPTSPLVEELNILSPKSPYYSMFKFLNVVDGIIYESNPNSQFLTGPKHKLSVLYILMKGLAPVCQDLCYSYAF
jgi:hypothetical protein